MEIRVLVVFERLELAGVTRGQYKGGHFLRYYGDFGYSILYRIIHIMNTKWSRSYIGKGGTPWTLMK